MLKLLDGNTKPLISTADYIWHIGKRIFSTKKLIEIYPTDNEEQLPIPNINPISFQSDGKEYILNPVHYVLDPFQKGVHYIILCDVYEDSNTPHKCNTRNFLNKVVNGGGNKSETIISYTQQFYLYSPKKHLDGLTESTSILGWDNTGIKPICNSHYGVGTECVSGREILNEFLKACMDSGILICGFNAEDDLGKWSFKVGYRNFVTDGATATPIIVSDHLIFARYLLQRICEKYDLSVDYQYNNCNLKVNFSTWATRAKGQKLSETVPCNIKELISTLENYHSEYLLFLKQPPTSYKVRVPLSAKHQGYGHIEDERPKGDSDPYIVCSKLIEYACGIWVSK